MSDLNNRRPARRDVLMAAAAVTGGLLTDPLSVSASRFFESQKTPQEEAWQRATDSGLTWLAGQQTRLGHWAHDIYPTAMTALAGTAMVCSGSTATQGPFAENIRKAVDYLITKCRPNGLIGDPIRDNRYTYGHGFSMLFLSQVLGEEEDAERRDELTEILQRSVDFSIRAQTRSGGWGYVSATENSSFDEGSTTITQVQGLRACRNAGIVVSKEVIEKARQYIYDCKNADGGISYSSRTKGTSRHAITAAALSALYNAGDYESEHIEPMWQFCKKHLHDLATGSRYGHWHYTYLYYAQVVYRKSDELWQPFRDQLYTKIARDQQAEGSWTGNIAKVYVTACNLIILQLDKGFLPIYQR